MQKGDIVSVYQDPITRQKEEGRARLIKKDNKLYTNPGTEFWQVQFVDDSGEPILYDPLVWRIVS
jgi:hypothetical protein